MAEQRRGDVAQSRLTAIVESQEVAIISKSLDGTIQTWNPGAERIYGYTAEEAIGHSIAMLIPPESANELPRIIERLKRGEIVRTYETIRVRKDGSRFDASISVVPVKGEQGEVVGAAAIARDISDRKQLERELQNRLHDLREVDRRKDEFLAMLAHELRNPLAPLQSALEILAAGVADSNMIEWAREVMERQVDQLVRLVDGLLDVSRIMQGRIELHKEPAELANLVARAVETAQPLIDSRGHKLTVVVPPQTIWVEADVLRLVQVLTNLLNNAAKYTKTQGQIRLTAGQDGNEAVVRISDNGIGIPADMLPRVFDLFVQANPTVARSEGGLGIGLTLVRRIVELHGGRVSATSSGADQGSEFEVRLPAMVRNQAAARVPEQAAVDVSHQPIGRHRVLVVEDNLYAAKSFAALVRLDGHEVQIAHDGPAALEMATAFHPDVILLDIGLPGIDGYEVARQLRAQPEFARTKIIAMTGYGQPEDRRRSKEAGINHHLVKPVKIDFVRALLARGDSPENGMGLSAAASSSMLDPSMNLS
ncbi:MAG TPA: PAS domain S-box protein [Pirellulales bacterium]|nr:PAS domain S-box protein [Pirellulales bacterium]